MHFGIFHMIRIVFATILLLLIGCGKSPKEETLLLYCAAGLKAAVEPAVRDFEKETGIRVDIQYGGSGTLLSNLRVAQKGDLYIAADWSYMEEGKKHNLLAEIQPLCHQKPIIAVRKGNPKGIQGLDDLLLDGIKVAVANPDAASIGRQTKSILQKTGHWDRLEPRLAVLKPTVNELANDLKIGSIDAAIIWDSLANQYPELESIEVEAFNDQEKEVGVAVLKGSKAPPQALSLLRYLSAPSKGGLHFTKNGYRPIAGDEWSTRPKVLLFSGSVNRVGVEQTIQEFEVREGVRVERVYNGCGILVGQIEGGSTPDLYLTCDVSFMDQVEDRFTSIRNTTSMDIVVVVPKDNPAKINSLKDLARPGTKVGLCNPKQSALGALTDAMLDILNMSAIKENVVAHTPTGDLLVNQIRTGSLDAAVVYRANLSQVLEHVQVFDIPHPQAKAIQNVGIAKSSATPWLTARLIRAIESDASQSRYEKAGFSWEGAEG